MQKSVGGVEAANWRCRNFNPQAAGKVGEQCMLPVPALVGVDSSSRIRALHWCQGFCPFITQTQGPRCVECAPRAGVLALAQANGAGSMAPAAPPGKPRCWVSEGVGCLKVQRERGPGFPRPAEAENFEPFFLGGCQEADAKRRTEEEEEEEIQRGLLVPWPKMPALKCTHSMVLSLNHMPNSCYSRMTPPENIASYSAAFDVGSYNTLWLCTGVG